MKSAQIKRRDQTLRPDLVEGLFDVQERNDHDILDLERRSDVVYDARNLFHGGITFAESELEIPREIVSSIEVVEPLQYDFLGDFEYVT